MDKQTNLFDLEKEEKEKDLDEKAAVNILYW